MNKIEATAALCEVELNNGKNCGVLAIGRCATCGRAFCAAHQAGALRTDLCAPCRVEILAEASAPRDYFQSGQAQTALLASGIQSVDMYWFEKQWEPKKGLFGFEKRWEPNGRGSRYVDVVVPLGRSWILGEIRWEYTVFDRESSHSVEENWLTALLDEPRDEKIAKSILYGLNLGLYPVKPCPGGYTPIRHDAFLAGSNGESLRAAAQTVKRLTGASS